MNPFMPEFSGINDNVIKMESPDSPTIAAVKSPTTSLRLTVRHERGNSEEYQPSESASSSRSRPRGRKLDHFRSRKTQKEPRPSQPPKPPRPPRPTRVSKAPKQQPKRPEMAHGAEDCATVLEQFVHDVANLPLEINHLMEEIQAKDKVMQDCRATINSRDGSIQKFIKLNGSLAPNPKEDQYSKSVLQSLDKCSQLQDEKIQLSEKACVLLDRQIKRLDVRIRDLVNEGLLSNDPPLPSMFDKKVDYREPPKKHPRTRPPLNPTSGNSNPILAAAHRLNQATPRISTAAALAAAQGSGRSSAPATPAAAGMHLQQRQRESSAGAIDSKRRRLNPPFGTLPAASSNLRQSSLGPGTPKAGTPAGSRAGSVQPRGVSSGIKKALTKKIAPHQQVKKIKSSAGTKSNKRSSSASGRIKASKKSPGEGADDDDDSMLSSADMSESDKNDDSAEDDLDDDDDEDEGNEDTKVYCTCRTVSHGDMVACDNDNCPYEWFHWKCVGLTREPVGTWYCDECRRTLGK
ncbi:Zinc finger PHD-type [Penicillium manginii]|uniref:Zinc finger PHD-type n=1 Tax=Penicillium manginii TaxID=203109 RepID=UPI002548A3F5|nr:Zinc finger PHD-type [Penicillium manginii]KAJ5761470.1 Zinc finger PHD-type [Penicillium manginii]